MKSISWDRASIRWNPAVDPDGDKVIQIADLFFTKPGETNVTVRSFPSFNGQVDFFELPPATTFSVRIRATDGIYWSESSLFRNRFTTSAEPKNPVPTPSNLKVIKVDGEALLTWDFQYFPLKTVHFLPEIRVRAGTDFGTWIQLPGVRSWHTTVTNILGEEEVQFRIRASDGNVMSTYSPIITFQPSAFNNSAPTAPDSISAGQITSGTAKLQWSTSRDLEKDVLTYELSYKPEQATNWIVAGTSPTNWFIIQGLMPNTSYHARVRTWDGEFWSDWRNIFQPFKTLPSGSGVLSAPFPIVVSQISSNSASVNWRQGDGPEGVILVYELELAGDTGHGAYRYSDIGIWTETNALLTLNPDTTYWLRIRTRYQTSTSDWSYVDAPFKTLPVTNPSLLPIPSNFKATYVGTTVVRLSWSPITNQVGANLVYEISSQPTIGNNITTSTNILLGGLIPDTQYSFSIRAKEGIKLSQWSAPNIIVHTSIEPEPVPPSSPLPPVAVDFTMTSGFVSWGASKDNNADSITYELQWRRRKQTEVEEWSSINYLITKSSSAWVQGLVPGGLYDLRLRATDGTFTTSWVESEGTLMTLASDRQLLFAPPATQVDAVVTDEGIVLTWRALTGTQSELEEAGIGQVKNWVTSEVPIYEVGGYFRAVMERDSPFKQYRVRVIR